MTSKTPVRSEEDVDEKALEYGEIKALATGNPEILRKTQLDADVSKLKLIKQSYLSQIYDLEDKISRSYPEQIRMLEQKLINTENDVKTLKDNTVPSKDDFSKMTIKGVEYTEKEDAGKAILEVRHNKKNADLEFIGEYRGFGLEIEYNAVEREFQLTLKNKRSYKINLSEDIYGNIRRIDNALNSVGQDIPDIKAEIEDLNKQLETAKIEVQKPFPQEQELKEKMKELDEVNISLNLDGKEKTQVLDISDDEENEKENKNREFER